MSHIFLYRFSKFKVLQSSNSRGSYRVDRITGQRRFGERLKATHIVPPQSKEAKIQINMIKNLHEE